MSIKELKPYLSNIADAISEKISTFPNLFNKDRIYALSSAHTSAHGATDTGWYVVATGSSCHVTLYLGLASDYANKTLVVSFAPNLASSEKVINTRFAIRAGNTTTWVGTHEVGENYAICTLGDGFTNEELGILLAVSDTTTGARTEFNEIMVTASETPKPYIPYGEREKINAQDFASKISEVYGAGKTDGYTEGETAGVAKGKEAERKNFWNTYQNQGNRTLWQYAFYDWLWQDANYNPIYDIEATNVNNMYTSSYITDTKVPIDISGVNNAYYMFYNCVYLKTIRKLIVSGSVTFESTFYNCKALQSITIEGVIGNGFNVRWSPLTKESITSIINALSTTATGKTLSLKKTAVNTAFGIDVDDETTYPEGSEYYVLRHSRDNWTFSYK